MAAAEKSRDENNREDWEERVIALRMERQHLTKPAGLEEYNVLYRDLSRAECILARIRRTALPCLPGRF